MRSQDEIYRIVNPMLSQRAAGNTLIVGAGPQTHIQGNSVTSLTTLDYSESMLRQGERKGRARPVCADAASLPFDRGTFDTVILPFIVHHLGEDSVIETDKAVERVVTEASRVTRRDGRLIVVDLFLGTYLELIERSLYGVATTALNQMGRPMMFFYSLQNFLHLLGEQPLKVETVKRLDLTEPLVITLLAPRFKIRPKAHPAKFHFIECVKKP